MNLNKKTAGLAGLGGPVVSKAVEAQNYLTLSEIATPSFSATEFAENIIAVRFGLSPCMARLVAELAHLGGRLA